MSKIFNSVKLRKPKKSVFDLSHEKKLSCNMGDLVPIYLDEVVPGDKFRVSTEMLMRLAPMISPVMHRCNAYIHYFLVPNRLVWNEWEDFITGGDDGLAAPAYPYLHIGDEHKSLLYKGTLADYFGLPVTNSSMAIANWFDVSALPFRAYQTIYNEYYRDQNLEEKVGVTKNSTVDVAEKLVITQLRKRCWEKDYFTSALPWAQRGGSVNLPNTVDYKDEAVYKNAGSGIPANGSVGMNTGKLLANSYSTTVENIDGINITINDLRRATRLQQWLERNALGGSRYIEQIFAHFGVKSSDARLQRPEYLGGGKAPVVVSEVLSTVGTEDAPQGTMAGHGISVGKSNTFTKYFEEHGFVIGILSVLPRTAYQQGVEKMWLKMDKFDHYFPEFANLGEQPVLNKELYFDFEGTDHNEETFGYQSRYSEYKFKQSTVHGDFRDNLAFWHLGRIFSGLPALNSDFVKSDPTHRVFAVTDPSEHKLYVQIYNQVTAIRPMPYYGTPTL